VLEEGIRGDQEIDEQGKGNVKDEDGERELKRVKSEPDTT